MYSAVSRGIGAELGRAPAAGSWGSSGSEQQASRPLRSAMPAAPAACGTAPAPLACGCLRPAPTGSAGGARPRQRAAAPAAPAPSTPCSRVAGRKRGHWWAAIGGLPLVVLPLATRHFWYARRDTARPQQGPGRRMPARLPSPLPSPAPPRMPDHPSPHEADVGDDSRELRVRCISRGQLVPRRHDRALALTHLASNLGMVHGQVVF